MTNTGKQLAILSPSILGLLGLGGLMWCMYRLMHIFVAMLERAR